MTLVMAYCVLLSAALGAATMVFDHVLRSRRVSTRRLWLTALVLVLPVTGVVMFVPRVETVAAASAQVELPLVEESAATLPISEPALNWLALSDVALTVLWIASSVLLFGAILFGRWRVSREKQRARAGKVQGHDVLLTEDLGPAVAGVRQPVVFVPRWVVALDEASQRLLIAHEVEHVRRRDTGLLMTGAALTALVPWNPVAWWLARRLRIAVELDCDARVLAAHPDVRRYADLLLVAAGKPKFTSRFLAAHFGEHISDLERRIDAMTNTRWQFRSLVIAAAAALGLTMASCEAPRPEPLAPGKAATTEIPAAFAEFEVRKPAFLADGSISPKYPEILRQAGVEGEVLVSFVVDEKGVADPSSFKVIKSTHELFATAVRQALPAMRFTPAEAAGRKVRQVVQAPFSFTIVGNKVAETEVPSNSLQPLIVTGVPGSSTVEPKKLAFTVRKGEAVNSTPPNVVVLAYDGTELARGAGDGILKNIAPETIHTIEVLKGRVCAPSECPLIKITLVKDKTLGPPQLVRPGREEFVIEPKALSSSETDAQGAAARRRYELLSSPMNFEILSSTGEVVARYGSRQEFARLGHISDDLSASRTYSARECAALTGVTCPLTRLTLKPGREGAYRER